jgi:hypothetical protein
MIPSLAKVRVGRRHSRGVRLWLPLFLLWPLLVPLAVVLVVASIVLAAMTGATVATILRTAWQLACGFRGTCVEVDSSDVAFQVRFV